MARPSRSTLRQRPIVVALCVAAGVLLLAAGAWIYLRPMFNDMMNESLAAIDVGSLEEQWFRYEGRNREVIRARLRPEADWRALDRAEHVWVLSELAPVRVNDDTAPNLRADGFRDPWGRMYRFEVRQASGGVVRFRATSAGLDGEFGTADDLRELFAVPPETVPATQTTP